MTAYVVKFVERVAVPNELVAACPVKVEETSVLEGSSLVASCVISTLPNVSYQSKTIYITTNNIITNYFTTKYFYICIWSRVT